MEKGRSDARGGILELSISRCCYIFNIESGIKYHALIYSSIYAFCNISCELKVCITTKPENSIDYPALSATPELFILCVIPAFGL